MAAHLQKKLLFLQKEEENIESSFTFNVNTTTGYRLIDLEVLSNVFKRVICPECQGQGMTLVEKEKKKHGLSSCLCLECLCGYSSDFYTSRKCERGFDVNRRIIYTMRSLGQGYSGLQRFTALMNMPKPMTAKNYDKTIVKLARISKEVAEGTISDAVNEIKNPENEITETGVSVDGSWQRRGFSSHNGVVTAISLENGKILDVEPMSRICKGCISNEHKKDVDPVNYAEWRNSHVCKLNYKGSAPGMETVGTRRIFERSEEKHQLRYTQFLGDGDSKSFANVKDIYPGTEVQKLHCVGHFQKCIGTRCRNLKKTVKGLGGKGRLTNATIDRLQNYFGIAIRQNAGNLESMKTAALASLFHVSSSKSQNLHYPHCPTGKDSWCKYNQDLANSTSNYKHGPGLPMDIVLKLRPIYQELTSDKRLERVLHGQTQNQNESFNGTIWERLPKTKFVSLTQLKFGVYDAVANFNIGRKASVLIYEKMKMIPGKFTLDGCSLLNQKRLDRSLYRFNEKNKKRRKMLRGRKYKKDDQHQEKEGILYESGAFNV